MIDTIFSMDGNTAVRLHSIIDKIAGVRVLVVGDMVLDHYTIGKPTRISREAPIAVLEYSREYFVPGGGTNPACTIASLGGDAHLAGVVGTDEAGKRLLAELHAYGVHTEGVVDDPSRPTIWKRRIVAQVTPTMLQQVARIDHLDRTPISGEVEARLVRAIEHVLPNADAVLLSNYRSGTLTQDVVSRVKGLADELGKLVTVDSQGDLSLFEGCGLVKCNQPEAEEALRRPLRTEDDFRLGMAELLRMTGSQAVVVTRSAEGMSAMTAGGEYERIPVTNTSEVFDVTGAGDTVIALLTMGLVSGANLFDAARLANYAAGVVVRKWGNAVLKVDELRAAISV